MTAITAQHYETILGECCALHQDGKGSGAHSSINKATRYGAHDSRSSGLAHSCIGADGLMYPRMKSISFLFSALVFSLVTSHLQAQEVEILEESELQFLEAFTAPGLIFHPSLCSPLSNGEDVCTRLPVMFDTPFTQFPVVLRFFDATDAASVKKDRIESVRGLGDHINVAQFFLLDAHHGLLHIDPSGDATYKPVGLSETPVLKAGQTYRASLNIGMQRSGKLNIMQRLVVPEGTVLYRPVPLTKLSRERKWLKCEGRNAEAGTADAKKSNGFAHRYYSADKCGARFVVNIYGERSRRNVTSYVFPRQVNVSSDTSTGKLDQSYTISPKDPSGLYALEWWYAGKLLSRTRFEVKQ